MAIEYKVLVSDDGTIRWLHNGKLHREDGPAIIRPSSRCGAGEMHRLKDTTEWYYNGQLHRVDGPAVESDNGTSWYLHGKHHRIGGPAMELLDGTTEWWVDGRLHREDGPAAIMFNGDKYWWVGGVQLSEEQFNAYVHKKSMTKELTVAQIEELLGYPIKIVR